MAGWGGNDAALGTEIPQWAIRRAEELCGCNFYGDAGGVAGAFARYIAQHEQPPVDPATALVAAWSAEQDDNENNGDRFGNLSHFARWLIETGRIGDRKHKETGK